MSLERVVSAKYHAIVASSKVGPDKAPSVFYEWANGEVFLNAEETINALLEIGTMNYSTLVERIHEIFQNSGEFHEVRRLMPVDGLSGGKHVIYLMLPKPSSKR